MTTLKHVDIPHFGRLSFDHTTRGVGEEGKTRLFFPFKPVGGVDETDLIREALENTELLLIETFQPGKNTNGTYRIGVSFNTKGMSTARKNAFLAGMGPLVLQRVRDHVITVMLQRREYPAAVSFQGTRSSSNAVRPRPTTVQFQGI